MKQISLSLNENEFDNFMNLLKSFKSVKNVQTYDSFQINNSEDFELNESHKFEIENRLENYLNGSSKSEKWETIKAKLKSKN